MSEDITKLPKWAQSKFRQLEGKLKNAQELIATFGAQEKTEIEVEPVRHQLEESPIFLPNDYTLRFHLQDGVIDTRIENGRLLVMGKMGGVWVNLNARPQSSNCLSIGFEKEST